MRSAFLTLALVVAMPTLARAQESPPAGGGDTVQLSFHLPTKRPLLIDGQLNAELSFTVIGGKASVNETLRYEVRTRFIDDLEVLGEERDEATRTFVEATMLENGEIADPPVNGVVLRYVRAGEQVNVSIEGARRLPQPKIDGFVASFESLGFWLQFPASARVGDEVELDLAPLASVLVGDDTGKASGKATVKIASYDAATGVARFRGSANIDGQVASNGVALALACKADITIETCIPESRIKTVSLEGTLTISSPPADASGAKSAVRVEGKGKFSSRFATHVDAAVAAARAEKPAFRERVHKARAAAVSFALPSYYDQVELKGLSLACQRLLGSDGVAVISADVVLGAVPDKEAFYRDTKLELEKKHKSVQTESVSGPLGAGRAVLYEAGTGDDRLRSRIELYPLVDRVILFRLQADKKTWPAALAEFVKARKTLKRLKG